MNIDIGRSVTYPFEDRTWTIKLVILLLYSLVPGLNVIMWGGFAVSIARNILRREPFPMPAWDSWSDIAVRGLLSIAATALYFSPALVFACCLAVFSLFLGARAEGVSLVLRCCAILGGLGYVLAVSLMLGVGHLRYAQTDQFNVYLDFRSRLRDLRHHTNLFVTMFVYQLVLNLITVGVAIIAFGVIIIAVSLIASSGAFVALIMAPVVLVAFVILLIVTTLGFLANGYILGGAALAFEQPARPRQ